MESTIVIFKWECFFTSYCLISMTMLPSLVYVLNMFSPLVEIEERQLKARQGWSVLRKFIEDQKRKRKRQEQLNRWRMLDRLASRARSYQLRRELYVKYGVISSTTQKAQLQKPSKEMAMRVDQMISKFKETQFRPLTAPATSQPYRRTRARRNAHYIN